jgi:methionyl-tRNA formyltransferase
LRALLDSPHEVVAVITRPSARAGRGRGERISPVAALAAEAGLPVLSPNRPGEPEFLAELAALEPDCCPVVAYGALLPPSALAVPPHGWVNLHFSLLPAWRGAAPVQAAILHGDDVTGASTFLIEQGLDTGPVFGVLTETIRPDDTAGTLLDRLAQAGTALLLATMDGLEAGALRPQPQSPDGVSLAGKITTADAEVAWNQPGRHIDRLIRACTPAPGAWTLFRGQRLKLGPVSVVEPPSVVEPREEVGVPPLAGEPAETTTPRLAPGELRGEKNAVYVGTATAEVELGQVQPPGKKPMVAADWARGARLESGERLGG